MNDTIAYEDLGAYLQARRQEDTTDHTIRQQYTAWNRFARDLPDLAATSITQEHTDKAIERFREVTDVRPVTVANYTQSFRKSVGDYLHYCEMTGNVEYVPDQMSQSTGEHQDQANSGVLTYGDAWTYFSAYRQDNPDALDGKHWNGAFVAVGKRVQIDDMAITPEHTEAILAEFDTITATEKKKTRLKRSTVASYRTWFRQAARHYCGLTGIAYRELDISQRRRRTIAERQPRSEVTSGQHGEPDGAQVGQAAVTALAPAGGSAYEGSIGYTFLLRPGLPLTVHLPEDLTRSEADRLSQWVSSFVIEAPHQ